MSLAEVRNSQDSAPGLVQNSTESDEGDAFFKMMMSLTGYRKKEKKGKKSQTDQASSCASDGLAGSKSTVMNETSNTKVNSTTESESCPSSKTHLGSQPNRKDGFFSWERGLLSKKTNVNKVSNDETNHVDSNTQGPYSLFF